MTLGNQSLSVLCILFLVLHIAASKSLPLPSFVVACSKNDPNLNQCALDHGRAALPYILKGNPKLHIPVMDPLAIPEVKVERSGAVFITRNVNITGLKDVTFDDCNMDVKNRRIESWYSVQRLESNCQYEIKGRILVLPIEGNGDANFTLVGNKIYYWFEYDLVERDGDRYWNITASDMVFNTTRAYFHLTNLFNGDKALGDNMNQFLNENWYDVIQEIGPDIIVAVKKLLIALSTGFTSAYSDDTILPERV